MFSSAKVRAARHLVRGQGADVAIGALERPLPVVGPLVACVDQTSAQYVLVHENRVIQALRTRSGCESRREHRHQHEHLSDHRL